MLLTASTSALAADRADAAASAGAGLPLGDAQVCDQVWQPVDGHRASEGRHAVSNQRQCQGILDACPPGGPRHHGGARPASTSTLQGLS